MNLMSNTKRNQTCFLNDCGRGMLATPSPQRKHRLIMRFSRFLLNPYSEYQINNLIGGLACLLLFCLMLCYCSQNSIINN
jgi:hypothetical protein